VFTLLLAQGGEFAFVVFQAAAGSGAMPAETGSLLIGVVALSMLCTPLLLVLLDRWVLPRYASTLRPSAEEEISEPQSAPVLICGFGRYGQIVARVLLAQGIPATVLDYSVDILEVARTFGYRVFYGDATRLDLLRMAGAAQARVLVLAVDEQGPSLKIAALARQHFPHLAVVARARDLAHWNELRDLGVTEVQREVFESSLLSARSVLGHMGLPPAEADALLERFRAHNIALADRMYPHHKDRARMIAVAREGRSQLAEQLAKEREERQAQTGAAPTEKI
jgi:glutathione-regulated potassium-efflux system ancillary protein KefC